MSELVPADHIEGIVGIERHPVFHYGRAVSVERVIYVLHSQECKDSSESDLRDCIYSQALSRGIDLERWADHQDQPVPLAIEDWQLIPGEWEGEEG